MEGLRQKNMSTTNMQTKLDLDAKDEQLLQCLVKGMKGREIAKVVFMTEPGVWSRIKRMRRRCGAKTICHLVWIYANRT